MQLAFADYATGFGSQGPAPPGFRALESLNSFVDCLGRENHSSPTRQIATLDVGPPTSTQPLKIGAEYIPRIRIDVMEPQGVRVAQGSQPL